MNINDTYYIRILYYIYPTLSFVPQNDSCSRRPRLTGYLKDMCGHAESPQSMRPWFP